MSLASSIARTGHRAYLRSPEWRELRRLALERDGFRCRLCNSRWRLEVHYRRYPPPWEADQLSNLSTPLLQLPWRLSSPCALAVHALTAFCSPFFFSAPYCCGAS